MLLVSDVAHVEGRRGVGLPCLKLGPFGNNDSQPGTMPRAEAGAGLSMRTCYLVDPASSHMLVSKIKPCMCKYELIRTVKLRMAH